MKKPTSHIKHKYQHNLKGIIFVSVVAIIVILAGVCFTHLNYHYNRNDLPVGLIQKKQEPNSLSLVMVGDNLLHMPLISNAKTDNGDYNFDSLYAEMSDEFQTADLAVIVQETILGGETLGYSGYPLFNSPQEVGDSLSKAGFDVVLSATNHALDKGERGIQNALEFWKKYPQIHVLGIHSSQEEYEKINYIEKNGIKLALVNYTDSTNGIPLPKDKPYLVNVVNREKMKRDLEIAEDNADFTVVFMHWGTEYQFVADKKQKDLAKFLTEHGADLIMGSHPHVVQPAEWVSCENGNKSLVFYSLGNYVSRQKQAANLVGAMGKVVLSTDETGDAFIAYASITPTITHYNKNSRGFRVYPLSRYTDELASSHGVAQYDGKVSVERFKKIFENVFSGNDAIDIE